mmetsp:Transcript_14152/g.21740  ORF Transcript_14152/g.21740 Transcript_14152/m.21740 type:complete len:392 (+) Transcript_14152:176-1351(+)|eukprot:CAMPEP_0196821456 /NCGR_PEP_ID=MMETSP1362-20130617/79287_1 /TAXON_ID=163516 /ORGANISM="Leptocylindrus danicus, Strain CCMP1856" /LENGTH=391 /DNA_ID=CAMNT_0042200643 /DNA_START=114 /DNA_END=1286 /DNA_ORIENTATION=+
MKAALSIIFIATANAFIPSSIIELSRVRDGCGKSRCMVTGMATSTSASSEVDISNQIANLKRVLLREYTSFFDPMEVEYYSDEVTFSDPLTSLAGVDSYKKNVDMLAGRTFLGSLLFDGAKINLHKVTGGSYNGDSEIEDIQTRWTLKVTAKILPWAPTASFTGISVYKLAVIDSKVKVIGQEDYWDSINLMENSSGQYAQVDKSKALNDFFGQIKPSGLQAQQSAAEIPYELLRRGKDYEVRRYPEAAVVKSQYTRRDEGYELLGRVTRGMKQFAPAIMTVGKAKEMKWFVGYALPGNSLTAVENFEGGSGTEMVVEPAKIIAVGKFNDAALEPIVRKCNAELKAALDRDGLVYKEVDSVVQFAQYDAVYTMGDRRGEVWLELDETRSPW